MNAAVILLGLATIVLGITILLLVLHVGRLERLNQEKWDQQIRINGALSERVGIQAVKW